MRLGLPESLALPAPARPTSPPRLVPLTALTASWLTGRSIFFERLLALPVWHTPRVSVWLPPVLLHGLLALSSCLTALFHGPLALSARHAPRFPVMLRTMLLHGLLVLAVCVWLSLIRTA